MCSNILEAMYILVNISKSERVTISLSSYYLLHVSLFLCFPLSAASTSLNLNSLHSFLPPAIPSSSGLVFFDNFCSPPPSPRIILLSFTLNLELEYFTLYLIVKGSQLCQTLWPMDYTVYRFLQARILLWVAIPFSKRSSQTRDQTQVSRIAGRF